LEYEMSNSNPSFKSLLGILLGIYRG